MGSFSLAYYCALQKSKERLEKQRALHSKDSGANYNSPSQEKKRKNSPLQTSDGKI